jgi:hypothetical protein
MRAIDILALGGLILMMAPTPCRGEKDMKRLSKAQLAKAREFIMTQARPLEQALFRFGFEGGSRQDVLAALADYQNGDGGFGKALEPDQRAPESSVLATIRALQLLTAIEAPRDDPLVKGAMTYLISTFDELRVVWPIIPPTAGAHPHAPWWNQETLEQAFGGFKVIPTAEVLGYLYTFGAPAFSPEQRLSVLQAVMKELESQTDAALAGGVECCSRLYESGGVPAEYKDRLYARLVRLIPAAVQQDPAKWKEYCTKPLWIVRTPASPFAGLLAESIERNLDYEIENQSRDGSWSPNWSWYGAYPDVWPTAEKEWRGVLTVQTLETLKAFGRIEP